MVTVMLLCKHGYSIHGNNVMLLYYTIQVTCKRPEHPVFLGLSAIEASRPILLITELGITVTLVVTPPTESRYSRTESNGMIKYMCGWIV